MLFIISAPSGSGKSTLVAELMRLVPDLDFSISYTTRPPRGSEINGREYFFVNRDEFQAMVAQHAFLEHAEVFGNFYGTAWSFLEQAERQRQDLVLDIDVQGALQVKDRLPGAISIFIAPPDRQTLEWRLKRRGLDAPSVVEHRLADASREIAAYNRYDYVVINDKLETSVEQLCAIVVWEKNGRRADPALQAIAESCQQASAAQRLFPVLASFGLDVNSGMRNQ